MNIAVLAATGKAGRLITLEALNRGHSISAFVRDSGKAKDLTNNGAKVIQKDIFALESKDLAGFDVVIDAFGEWKDFSLYKKHRGAFGKNFGGKQGTIACSRRCWKLLYGQKPHYAPNGYANFP